MALAAGAFSAASQAAPRIADKIGPAKIGPAKISKDERLTCAVRDDGKIVVTNSSIYYLLKGAKLHLSYRVFLAGSPNRVDREENGAHRFEPARPRQVARARLEAVAQLRDRRLHGACAREHPN